MISVNTNLYAMQSQNYSRLNLLEFGKEVEQLSSGYKVNNAADDPSGLSMASGMKAQVRGISAALQNIQDDINLVHTADAALGTVQDAVLRMRDLCLRLANRATLNANPTPNGAAPPNYSDSRVIKDELSNLADSVRQLAIMIDYNGKGQAGQTDPNNPAGLLFGTFAPGLQTSQVGPNHGPEFNIGVVIPSVATLVAALNPVVNPLDPPPNADDQQWLDYATSILSSIDEQDAAVPQQNRFGLNSLSDARASLGVLENRFKSTMNDLQAEFVNVTQMNSRIMDSDFADEATQKAKSQIIMQSADAVATQATAEPRIISSLLGAIYTGMPKGPFS